MLMLVSMLVPLALVGWAISDDDDDGADDNQEINGNAAANDLEGGTGEDLIQGQGGNDNLFGRAGDDTVFGHGGQDILEGADGDDMLCSGDGDDIVTGNRGEDFIEGQGGDDWISGDYNGDNLHGDQGDDTVIGGRGIDRVIGNEGDDVLFGGIIEDAPLSMQEMQQLRDGANLGDVLNGEGRIDMRDDSIGNRLFAGAGDDQLFLGSGDRAVGGEGEDTFNIMSAQVGMGVAVLEDYDEDDDSVTIVFSGPLEDAEIDVRTNNNGETAISVNGTVVGCIMDGQGENLTAEDITVIRESDVVDMFDPNA